MDRREPVLLPPDGSVIADTSSPSPCTYGKTEVFKARFLLHEPGKRKPRASFSLYGKGEIRFGENDVEIVAKRHRLFWFGVREERKFGRERILDASATKKYVKFKVDNHLYGPRDVYFIADNAQQAQRILSLLPSRQSEEFAKDSAERSAFAQRLDALSPNSFVVYALVAANILVFIAMALGGAGFFVPKPDVAINWGTNFGPQTLNGQWWRLLTATFIHFGIAHLAFNMLALYQTGRTVERLFGSLHFLLLYVVAGLSGSIVSLLWHPWINSAGASGAIFGVFGGLLAFVLNSKNGVPKSIMAEHRTGTLAFIAYNLVNGFSHAGIDNGAHIGGLVGGFVMGLILARPLDETRRQGASTRILIASTVGMFGLAIASYPLYRPDSSLRQDLAFQLELSAFGIKEHRALNDFKTLLTKIKAGAVSEAEIAPAIEQDILPQWNAMSKTMADIRLADTSKWSYLQQALLHYIDSRRTLYQLMADGQRNHDQEAFAKAMKLDKDINAQIASMKQLVQKLQSGVGGIPGIVKSDSVPTPANPSNFQPVVSTPSIEDQVAAMAREVSSQSPKMVNRDTRLDGATADPGLRLTYHYTLTTLSSNQVLPYAFRTKFAPKVRASNCASPQLKALLNNGVTIVYDYRGKDRISIGSVEVNRAICGHG